MERLTQINGNNEVYCIVEDKKIVVDNIDMLKICQRLKLYEDLEEQGLLLRLPCKVGTTVYIIVGKDISKQSIKRITIDSTGMLEFCTKRRGFQLSDFGKTVFLTQAEAEQKLKEMES